MAIIGGAILVGIVFSWGGAVQYAVQGVLNSNVYPVLGFVLFSAIFSLIVHVPARFVPSSTERNLHVRTP